MASLLSKPPSLHAESLWTSTTHVLAKYVQVLLYPVCQSITNPKHALGGLQFLVVNLVIHMYDSDRSVSNSNKSSTLFSCATS